MMAAGLCSVGLLVGTAVRAEDTLGADRVPDSPARVGETAPSDNVESTAEGTGDVAQTEPLECPSGQFPSAFADVYPFHWAYQAINNLASPSMQCFDLPEEFR